MVCAEFTLKRSHGECTRAINRAILGLNLPGCRGHTPATDSAPSPLSAPSVRTPRAYCKAANPALSTALGCCRTRPPRRCSRWQGWSHPGTNAVKSLSDGFFICLRVSARFLNYSGKASPVFPSKKDAGEAFYPFKDTRKIQGQPQKPCSPCLLPGLICTTWQILRRCT